MARTGGSRNFSDLMDAIRVLARRAEQSASTSGTYLDLDEGETDGGEEVSDGDREEFLDYDSVDGTMIPMTEEDLVGEHDEEEVQWAVANYRQERERWKVRNPNGGYFKTRDDLSYQWL